MIATLDEIKILLQISTTSQDGLISINIPIIEDEIREHCNNGFRNSKVLISSSDISFDRVSTGVDTIDLDIGTNEDGFIEANFKAGNTVQVQGSYNNDGFFDIETVTSTALTLYSSGNRPYFQNLVDEDEAIYIQINQVDYPSALKNIMAQMVKYKTKNYDYSIESESASRYSKTNTKADNMISGYPKAIITALNKFRQVRFV